MKIKKELTILTMKANSSGDAMVSLSLHDKTVPDLIEIYTSEERYLMISSLFTDEDRATMEEKEIVLTSHGFIKK